MAASKTVRLIFPQETSDIPSIQDVSFLHNYSYTIRGLRAWKAYQVGPGKLVRWEKIKESACIINDLKVVEKPSDSQKPVYSDGIRRERAKHSKADDPCSSRVSGLFCCPVEQVC